MQIIGSSWRVSSQQVPLIDQHHKKKTLSKELPEFDMIAHSSSLSQSAN